MVHIKWMNHENVIDAQDKEASNRVKKRAVLKKMASTTDLASIVLNEMDLPEDLFWIFEGQNFDSSTLINISKDELVALLAETRSSEGQTWNIDEIFRRIVSWRQEHGHDIIGFSKVEVEECWLESQELITSDAEFSQEQVVVVETSTNHENVSDAQDKEATQDEVVCQKDSPTQSSVCPEVTSQDCSVIVAMPRFLNNPSTSNETLPTQIPTATTNSSSDTPSENVNSAANEVHEKSSNSEIGAEKNDGCASCSMHFSPATLTRLLDTTVTGKQILQRGSLGLLSKDSQKELVAIVADYHCQRGAETNERVLEEYVNSITALFKGETKSKQLSTFY
ncbi:uncharacterized protein LOC134206071 [Armigeres subalbatus]|uniref:uncharacterized protein LOC134206071 n=1 Tax=Armigeres subalbatus TaxID=124917 RepID=UPI002ED4B896